MNTLEKRARWKLLVHWLAGASTLIYVISRFLPGGPPSYHGILDDSWKQVLHAAFDRNFQFGRDIVFTFGPWGFLCGGYHPATHVTSVLAWTALSLVFWLAGWRVACHFSNKPLISWIWLVGFTGAASIQDFDIGLIAWVLLLLFLHFFVEDHSLTITQALLVVSLGMLSLTKFTGLMQAVIVVAVIAADNVFRHRRLPWIVPLLAGSVLFFWVTAGQRLNSLGPFLLNSWRVTGGYTDAMMLLGEKEMQDIICFLLAAVLLCGLTGYAAWRQHRIFGMLAVIGLGALLFLVFKHGYVRHDWHEITAAMALVLVSMLCLAVVWPIPGEKKQWIGLAGLVLLALNLFFAAAMFARWYAAPERLPARLLRTFNVSRILSPVKLLRDAGYLQQARVKYLADVRNGYPLPLIKGDVDVYPWNQSAVFAQGLRYRPRPVIQSYSAYTPELAELNAAHLRSDRAASNILFEIQVADLHFPALDDGRSWPELLTRYDIKDVGGQFLLLTRAATPRAYRLTPLKEMAVRFGESVTLPSATNGPIWVEMEINKSLLGAAVSTLYKPPVLVLTVYLRDGRPLHYRLISGMARSGFLLSPLVANKALFVSLASGDSGHDLADEEVVSLRVSVGARSGSPACYQSPMQLRLYRLDFPRQKLNPANAGFSPEADY